MDEFTGPIYGKDFENGAFWKNDEHFSSNDLKPALSLKLRDGSEKTFGAAWRMGVTDQFAYLTPEEGGVDWEASGYQQVEDPATLTALAML